MSTHLSSFFAAALLVALGSACAPATPSGDGSLGAQQSQGSRSGAPKRIAIAVNGDPHTLYQKFNPSSTVRGVEELEQIVHAGFTIQDVKSDLRPQLAEQVPSLENGLWKLLPDGGMETTWKIRSDALWHDGTPVTGRDALFAATVGQDRELAILRHRAFAFVDRIESPDPQTVIVVWKQAYVQADQTFSSEMALPLPSHILEQSFINDRAGFTALPFWTSEWVGAGPYRVKDFVRGSHMTLEANDKYVLGRPRIDAIEVKFIVDANTLLANVLSGTVDVALGRGLSLEQGLQVRDQWRDGKADMAVASFLQVFPQLLNPNPSVISNPQFRRAMLRAIDRQEMVDSIQSGVVPVAHIFVGPDDRDFKDIEPAVVKYDYDPALAARTVEQLGYSKGADGIYAEVSGQRLSVEVRATAGDLNSKTMYAVASYWQKLGLVAETVSIPPQRASDLEYRSNFPGFGVQRQGGELTFMTNFNSAQARVAETRYAGNNNTRYMNPELDLLINRFESTIPRAERMEIARQGVHHITDLVVELPLFYDVQPALIANRMANVAASRGSSLTAWNIHQWDIR